MRVFNLRCLGKVFLLCLVLFSPFVSVLVNTFPFVPQIPAVNAAAPVAWLWMTQDVYLRSQEWIFNASVGESFSAKVSVDVKELYSWEFWLSWNASLLDFVSIFEGAFLKGGGTTTFYYAVYEDEVGLDYLLANCTLEGAVPGVTGWGTIATVTFTVDGTGGTRLDLYDTKLFNSSQSPIGPVDVDDGYFVSTGLPLIYPIPQKREDKNPGENFTITVYLDEVFYLFNWGFELGWNPPELLEVAKVEDGGFFANRGVPHYFSSATYSDHVFVGDTIMGPYPGVNGSDPLAIITFKVCEGGVSTLDLRDTKLKRRNPTPPPDFLDIPHAVMDGSFRTTVPYVHFTWSPRPEVEGYEPAVNPIVTFNATECFDPDGGNIVKYDWDFGDGTTTSETNPIAYHAYSQNKTNILVNLTVTDNEGEKWRYWSSGLNVVIRDIAVTHIDITPTGQIKNGTPVDVSVEVQNIGTGTENFNVTLYANSTVIDTKRVTNLNPKPPAPPWRHIKLVNFTWDTSDYWGKYNITAVAVTNPGENNPTNNKLFWGYIFVSTFNILNYNVKVYGATFGIVVETDSIVSKFAFDYSQKQIRLNVTGVVGMTGYINVTIPRKLLDSPPPASWVVLFDDTTRNDYIATVNATHTFMYLSYTFSFHIIKIIGSHVPTPPQPFLTLSTTKAFIGETVTLDGSLSTDPDNEGIREYFWNVYRLSPLGEIVSIWNKTTTEPTATVVFSQSFFGEQALRVTLTVTNNLGLKNTTVEKSLEVFWPYNIKVLDIDVSKTLVNIGEFLYINITVTSTAIPPVDVRLTATVYGNDVVLPTEPFDPTAPPPPAPAVGANETIRLKWNTANAGLGLYTLKVTVTVKEYGGRTDFPPELETSDNTLSYGNVLVKKWDSIISIVVSPQSFSVGDSTMITGEISPVPPSGTTVMIQSLTGSVWNNITTTTTTTRGRYSYKWTHATAGTYQIRAAWNGNATVSGNVTSIVPINVKKLGSTISLEVSPTSVSVGSPVILSGTITPKSTGVTVTIHVRKGGVEYASLTGDTDSDGNYSVEWTPTEAGTYEIQAIWEGDVNTLGSESETKTITVQAPSLLNVYTFVAIGAAIIIVALAIFFLKRQKSR